MMHVSFIEENNKKKFAVLPYRDFVRLAELAADTDDYEKALKVLGNKKDEILDYDPETVLVNPILTKRKELNLTQAGLAKILGTTTSYISKIEHSGANLSKKTLAKVAHALRCEMSDLI